MHHADYPLPVNVLIAIHLEYLFLHVGIDVSFNASCAESELNKEDYLKILWAAAAELPGIMYLHALLLQ